MNNEIKIKEIRESKRIRQIEVADALNMDNSQYAKIEKRGKKLSIEQIEKIAEALGVSLIELLGLDSSQVIEQVNDNDKDKEIADLKKRVAELEDRIIDKELRIEMYSEIIYELVETLKKIFEINIIECANILKLGIIEWTFDINPMFIELVKNLNTYKRQYTHIGYTTNKDNIERNQVEGDYIDFHTVQKHLILNISDLEKIFTFLWEDDDFFDGILDDIIIYLPEKYIKTLSFLNSELLDLMFNLRENEETAHKIITQIYDTKSNRISNNVTEFIFFKFLEKYPPNIVSINHIRKDITTRIQDYRAIRDRL